MSNKKLDKDKRIDNLIPAKKGEIRNPAGRPKKENTYSDTLRDLLQGQDIEVNWTVNGKKKSLTVSSDKNLYYGVASAQIMEALKGNIQAQKEIVDRIQGKAPQGIDVTTDGEKITTQSLPDEILSQAYEKYLEEHSEDSQSNDQGS